MPPIGTIPSGADGLADDEMLALGDCEELIEALIDFEIDLDTLELIEADGDGLDEMLALIDLEILNDNDLETLLLIETEEDLETLDDGDIEALILGETTCCSNNNFPPFS